MTKDKNEFQAAFADPLYFLSRPRQTAKKRGAQRNKDFNEIYIVEKSLNLQQQANRCLDCGNPYCEWKCPLHNYIPNWLDLVSADKFTQAAELMHETNPMPEICGRVCPQDRLCEQACTLNTGFGAVTIGDIEKSIADRALADNWRPDLSAVTPLGKSVAIVGAGPAGLGCAELLVRHGVKAVVFDRNPQIGGLLTFGIPAFKLEKEIVQKRRQFLEDIGVEFHLNTEIGKDITVAQLKNDYDALFLGTGTYGYLDGNLPGLEIKGVHHALDYLIGNINQQQSFNMSQYPYIDTSKQRVVVLGGGDTAMDCVRTAVRQQAKTVQCIYRRKERDMPGSKKEIENAKDEGVALVFDLQPLAIVSEQGQLKGVEFASTQQQNGEKLTEVVFVEADCVIIAFGFKANPQSWFDTLGLKQHKNGLVKTIATTQSASSFMQKTHADGVYAGGDMVRGADLVVTAIADGRQAAREILENFSPHDE